MSGFTLKASAAAPLRLDLRGITPTALATLSAAEVGRLPIGHGNALVPLAEFFQVEARGDDTLVLAGELSRCDRIGWQMDGGTLRIDGSVGDFAASTLPGSMDGMRGGTLIVGGNAGARFGDRMRRGSALVFGDAGDFLASRMVAGTIALAGRAGAHAGYGMRRGSVVFAGPAPGASPTFVSAVAGAPVFWQLLARDLAPHGGPFATLASRGIDRHLGDVAAGGKGELILVR
jgi:formylmethanofuran dehydrogenase subunit C